MSTVSFAGVTIRPVRQKDRNRLLEILIATKRFTDDEIAAAIGQVDHSLRNRNRGDYIVHVAETLTGRGKGVEGYVCHGPTPKSAGVWDLYWIAVDPAAQRKGIGRRLLGFVEEQVKREGGRTLLIETQAKESYRPTLAFYRSCGYTEITRLKDFYRLKHDKIIFSKRFD